MNNRKPIPGWSLFLAFGLVMAEAAAILAIFILAQIYGPESVLPMSPVELWVEVSFMVVVLLFGAWGFWTLIRLIRND